MNKKIGGSMPPGAATQAPKEWRIAYECYSDTAKKFQFEAVSLPTEAECDAWESHLLPIRTNNIRKQWRIAPGPWQDASGASPKEEQP